jgi:hypothetical protein
MCLERGLFVRGHTGRGRNNIASLQAEGREETYRIRRKICRYRIETRKFRGEIDKQKQGEMKRIQNGKPKDRGSSERFNHINIGERERDGETGRDTEQDIYRTVHEIY